MNIIISRHAGAISWIEEKYPSLYEGAKILSQVSDEKELEGNCVIGNLPSKLAEKCHRYYAIEFAETPPRGVELTKEDMYKYGAHLTLYTVTKGYKQPWLQGCTCPYKVGDTFYDLIVTEIVPPSDCDSGWILWESRY